MLAGKLEIRLDLWTRASINDAGTAARVLASLATIAREWFPRDWYNISDDIDINSADDIGEVVQLWVAPRMDCGSVLGGSLAKPKTSLLVAFLCQPSRKEHMISFNATLSEEGLQAGALRTAGLMQQWAAILEADYGRVCAGQEWNRKNVIEQFVEPDGLTNSWKVFHQDITTGLPGVYWGTYFGRAYVDWLGGDERFEKAPWPRVERCGDGFLLFRADSPFTWEEEHAQDAQLRQWLGDDAFFDIERRDRVLRTPNLEIPNPYGEQTEPPPRAGKSKPSRTRARKPRGGKERLKGVPNAAELVRNVVFFRRLGFFSEWARKSDEDLAGLLYDLHEREWGSGFSEETWLADLELLRWDSRRVWWQDTEADVGPGNDVYVQTLEEWSKISRGSFLPSSLEESWATDRGPVSVSFELDGAVRTMSPRFLDDFIDVAGVAGAINRLIAPSGLAFQLFESFDQTAFVIVLSDAEAETLTARGWRFQKLDI